MNFKKYFLQIIHFTGMLVFCRDQRKSDLTAKLVRDCHIDHFLFGSKEEFIMKGRDSTAFVLPDVNNRVKSPTARPLFEGEIQRKFRYEPSLRLICLLTVI